MNILVTGGSGFLGSHIADELTNFGHNVIIYDRVQSKYLKENQSIICGDITDKNLVIESLNNIDCVYHFAGISGIEDCKKNPKIAIDVNINGTVNVLEGCVKNNVKRIMFASSAYVFSKYGYIYKTTKIACENIIRDYNEIYGILYTNIRFGSLYGRRADERNSIHKILNDALKYKKIVYYGSGNEIREYIHVIDAAKSSVNILTDDYINKDILITGQEKYKYKDLLEMIKEILGEEIEIIFREKKDNSHYTVSPYSFNAKIGTKIMSNEFVDFGQGILDCLLEISNKNNIL